MARRPDTPCSICGRLLWSGSNSRPADSRVCRPCRAVRRVDRPEMQREACEQCGTTLLRPHPSKGQRFCSRACCYLSRKGVAPQWRTPRIRVLSCAECGTAVITTGTVVVCGACKPQREREQWQRKNRRRRAVKRGATSEPYTLAEIAVRDGRRCQLCRRKVNMNLRAPNRMAPTIDHVIPIFHGGDDTRANVQLAHYGCNSRKRDRGSQQLALIG